MYYHGGKATFYSKYSNFAKFIESSVSHDPPEIILICWFDAWETFLIIIIIINNISHYYQCWKL